MAERNAVFLRSQTFCLFVSICLLCILNVAGTVQGEEIKFFENTEYLDVPQTEQLPMLFPYRRFIDLNGTWEFRHGEKNDTEWRKVNVPSCYAFQGRLYFRKTFIIENFGKNIQFRLYALGINYRCLITINGIVIGSHTGGYSSFLVDIPNRILKRESPNTIEIEVDNRLNIHTTIPLEQQIWGWLNYGGIFREIYIVEYPRVSIDDAYVRYTFQKDYKICRLDIAVELSNNALITREIDAKSGGIPLKDIPVIACRAELYDPELDKIVAQSPSPDTLIEVQRLSLGHVSLALQNPVLWNFTSPKRYKLRVIIIEENKEVDIWTAYIGLRDVSLEGGSILLNGNPLKLQGLTYFEDLQDYGNAVNWQSIEKDIIQMKDLGINLVLGGLYPCHPYVYTLCDIYGLFIIESIPLWQIPRKMFEHPGYMERSRDYLQEMILRDRNHPSILAWGLGMELETTTESGRRFLLSLHRKANELDVRPTLYTTSYHDKELAGDVADILGLSFRKNVPLEKFSRNIANALERYRDRPVIIGRFGRELIPRNNDMLTDYTNSVERQAKYIEDCYQQIKHFSELDGHILWSYADWWGQRPLLILPHGANPYLYSMGILDYQHHERIGYRMVKALLSGDERPTLNITSQNQQETYIFQIVGLIVLILLVYTSKRSIRFGENIKRSIVYRKSFFLELGTRQILPFVHTLFLIMVNSIVLAMLFSALLFYFRQNVYFDYFISQIIVWNRAKEIFARIAWEPWAGILYGALIFFLGSLIFAFIISLTKVATKRRIEWKQIYHIIVWAGSPIILLIPLAMTLYPALDYQGVLPFTLVVCFIFIMWTFNRIVSGLSVVYNCSGSRIYIIFGTIIVFIFVLIGYSYQNTRGTFDYFQFYISLFYQ